MYKCYYLWSSIILLPSLHSQKMFLRKNVWGKIPQSRNKIILLPASVVSEACALRPPSYFHFWCQLKSMPLGLIYCVMRTSEKNVFTWLCIRNCYRTKYFVDLHWDHETSLGQNAEFDKHLTSWPPPEEMYHTTKCIYRLWHLPEGCPEPCCKPL